MADKTRTDPVLNIQTLGPGVPIRIDGRLYHVRHPNKLSIESRLEFDEVMERAPALLMRVRKLTKQEREDLSVLLDRACRVVLDAPSSVQKGLIDSDRISILHVFIDLRPKPTPQRAGGTAQTTRPASPSTGESSSRGSRGSTRAARRLTGSAASRSGS